MIDSVESANAQVFTNYENIDNGALYQAVNAVYLAQVISTLVLAVLMVVFVSCICCCDKLKMRKAMYFVCFLFFFLAILGFLLAFAFSLTTAVGYLGCTYFGTGLESPSQFRDNFGDIINDDGLTLKISSCVPSGNGTFLEDLIGPEVNTFFDNSEQMFSLLSDFDGLGISSSLNQTTGLSLTI